VAAALQARGLPEDLAMAALVEAGAKKTR
jgi:hypothetical protein